MKEIICVNASFGSDALEVYKKYGVITPEQDKLYTIRDVIRNSNGETGLLLEELVNPKIPDVHSVGMIKSMEPNFHHKRFVALDGTELNLMEILQEIKLKQVA